MSAIAKMQETKPTGAAIAALMSPMLGLIAYAIANLLWEATRFSPPINVFTPILLKLGSWIPSGDRIGPYSGKETILLVVWLGSWGVLHLLLGKRRLKVAPWAIAFVIGIALAALMVWPPFMEILVPEWIS